MSDVIFDIDGTIADLTHRLHYVTTKPKNWPAFNKAISNDVPIWQVIEILFSLKNDGWRIILCSGRSEDSRQDTIDWLIDYGIWDKVDSLYMRKSKDYRADNIIKEELLDQILIDGFVPMLVFDDRKRVVDMWRRRGLFVFDCNQSGKDF
jgi:phosphoglycolate phosphatase-like HAD superfamily hydrolase